MTHGWRRALGAAGAVVVAGCAVNPVTGRPELALVTRSQERELGRMEAERVAATMGLVAAPVLEAYVQAIGQRLGAGSPRQDVGYTFHVVDMEEPNAFALPGGYVYVSRGLLALMNSEDELAGVIGHEVAHVAGRHAVQRVSRAAPIGIVTGIGSAVTGFVSPPLGNLVGAVGEVTGAMLLAPYSRSQEREADRLGAELAARAGWEPVALADALHTLEREEALGPERGLDFFATHPPLPQRVDLVRREAAALVRTATARIAPTRDAFLARVDGIVVGPSAAEGVFAGRTFLHPDMDVALAFPAGWETVNGRATVGARAPDDRAVVALEVVGEGDDPAAAVAALERESGARLLERAERVTIDGRRALRVVGEARSDGETLGVDLTWVAHDHAIFRVTGAARARDFGAFATVFRTTAGSFRGLTPAERAGLRETRLRMARTRAGESLATLAARVRSRWTPEMLAVANGLEPEAPCPANAIVKVAVSEPYRP